MMFGWNLPPLRVCFPRLFEICDNKEGAIVDYAARGWQLRLIRMLGDDEMREWTDLQSMLRGVTLSQNDDEVSWGLTSLRIFTTGSLYRFMTNGGVNSRMASRIWKCKVPLKVRVFLWQVFHNRIQTAIQLKSIDWKGSGKCGLCGQPKDVNYLLFGCSLARFVWSFMGEALGEYGRSSLKLAARGGF
jgi:hypothetical protein